MTARRGVWPGSAEQQRSSYPDEEKLIGMPIDPGDILQRCGMNEASAASCGVNVNSACRDGQARDGRREPAALAPIAGADASARRRWMPESDFAWLERTDPPMRDPLRRQLRQALDAFAWDLVARVTEEMPPVPEEVGEFPLDRDASTG